MKMCPQRFTTIAILAVLLFFLLPVSADAGPAYRRLVPNPPNEQPWREGIVLRVDTDVEACKRAYHAQWFAQCQAPLPGRIGQRVEGIQMTPATPGTWRWSSESTLTFTPKTHLTPNTNYTISLEHVPFPQRYALTKTLRYVTPPQAVHIEHETLWIDPSPKGQHVITVPMTFLWPMDRAIFEKNVRIQTPSQTKLRLGNPRFVWNEDSDSVQLTLPLRALPEKNTAVLVSVTGFPAWYPEDGKRIIARGKTTAEASIAVTGTDRVMDIKKVVVEPTYDAGLNREYQLVVTTTLQTKPADLLEKLDLFLLPKMASPSATKACDWENMAHISKEDLAKSEKLTAHLLQPGNEPATEIRCRLDIPEGRGVLCAIKPGLASTGGYTTNRVLRFIRTSPPLSPEINFLQPGNILPLKKGQKLDIHTVGVETLVWHTFMVREPFLAMTAEKTGFDIDEDLDLTALSQITSGNIDLPKKNLGKAQYTALDLPTLTGQADDKSALMLVQLIGLTKGKEVCREQRLLLHSNIGLLLKTERNGSHVVFVQSLSSGAPVANATVQLLGANGLPVVSATTDTAGLARFPSTYGLSREKKPCVLTARAGNDIAWLPLNDAETLVNYSDFAVLGRHASDEGLIASVFSERGVYMPGETLHFGTIVRNHIWKTLGENLPLYAQLFDPAGTKLAQERIVLGADGFGTFRWKSAETSATGTYRLDICLMKDKEPSILGSVQTRVEEFQPDTLQLRVEHAGTKPAGWICTEDQTKLRVHLDNLYGEPAKGNRITARFFQNPHPISFSAFSDYTFVDTSIGEDHEIELPETTTDAQGEALLSLPTKTAHGSYVGRVDIEGFETSGGRAVGRSFTHYFSPKRVLLGYKPEMSANTLNYIPEGSKAALRFLVVDTTLAPQHMEHVRLSLSERRYVTSLVSDSTGRYRYDPTPVDTLLSEETLTLDPKGTLWEIPTAQAGDYLLRLTSSTGDVLGLIPYTIAGTKLAKPGTEPLLANGSLRLVLDKESYAAGETLNFQIAAPFAGRGIVTLERDSVVAHAFFTAEPGVSVHSLTIPKDFEGRGYVNVSFIRNTSSDAIYMTPYAYAVAPVTVGITQRDMGIRLECPKTLLPGSLAEIRISAKHTGRVQLFVVDEGILQLTNYATPNPLKDLLTDRALDVSTRESYHLLMPDHERLRGRIPGFGGGMGTAGGRFHNPFKRKSEPPFAFWSKVLSVKQDPQTVTVPIPSYFAGAFRVMAVGSGLSENGQLTAGASSQLTRVAGGIIIKPQLPLFVAPGDTFEGAIVLANTIEKSGATAELNYTITLPKGLERINGTLEGKLIVPEGNERVILFRAKALPNLGEATVTVTAERIDGTHAQKRSQSMAIRPANQKRATEHAAALKNLPKQGNTVFVTSERSLYPADASTSLTIAEGPLLALRALAQRLDRYPYGCTEQIISKAMPHVVLWDVPKIRDLVYPKTPKETPRARAEKAIAEAIKAIRASDLYEGVSLWPGMAQANAFVTAYAGDFLVTLQEHGLTAPEDLRERILEHLEDMVNRTPHSINDGRIKLYATWVLLRDGRLMTSQLTSLEDWFRQNANGWERDVLSSLIAESYAMIRMRKQAQEHLPKTMVGRTNDSLFSTGMARALHALVLLSSFSGAEQRENLLATLMDAAFSADATTVDLAMSSRALARAARTSTVQTPRSVQCQRYAEGFVDRATSPERIESILKLDAPGCERFAITGDTDTALYTLLQEDGFDKTPLGPTQNDRIEITKTLEDQAGRPATSVKLGDVVTTRICARSLGQAIDSAVLVDLVPGGLEPILEKDTTSHQQDNLIRYERREDRGLFFVDLTTEERCYTYRSRAQSRGQFTVPPTQGQAMYQPAVQGVSAASTLEIQ